VSFSDVVHSKKVLLPARQSYTERKVVGRSSPVDIVFHSHRNAQEIIDATPELLLLWRELEEALNSLTDERLLDDYQNRVSQKLAVGASPPRSLSYSINGLLDDFLVRKGWEPQSALFAQKPYTSKNESRWRLDFSKSLDLSDSSARRMQTSKNKCGIAVEVAFNHGEAIAWNLLKPVMAAELNHVAKAADIGEGVGVVITATKSMKSAGGFDGAVGEFQKVLRYLEPMRSQLTTPMLIVGLEAPRSFKLQKMGKKASEVILL